jgi:hypothetical protein
MSERVGDVELERITKEQCLVLINVAARDLINAGIVIGLTDSETLSATAGSDSVVPADFAYIHDIWGGTSFYTWIPWSHWSLRVVSSAPNIHWDDQLLVTTGTVRVQGSRRPNDSYAIGSGSIDTGMEAFIRERAASAAARQLAQQAEGATAQNLEAIAAATGGESDTLLQLLAAQPHFRPALYARAVPLR